jgi:hypothetical protein
MLRYLNTMTVSREKRMASVNSAIPGVLWYIVIIGAFITILFVLMLHMNWRSQIVLGGILSFFLGVMIFIIYAMDHPLRGAVSLPPDSFETLYEQAMLWDD